MILALVPSTADTKPRVLLASAELGHVCIHIWKELPASDPETWVSDALQQEGLLLGCLLWNLNKYFPQYNTHFVFFSWKKRSILIGCSISVSPCWLRTGFELLLLTRVTTFSRCPALPQRYYSWTSLPWGFHCLCGLTFFQAGTSGSLSCHLISNPALLLSIHKEQLYPKWFLLAHEDFNFSLLQAT